jgi:GNAT superfamily N-acetyltransferase
VSENLRPDEPAVTRLSEDEWRVWRAVRLAALAEAPGSFGSTLAQEQTLGDEEWQGMIRRGAVFVAAAGGTAAGGASVGGAPVGVAAGIRRPDPAERGLGAMWVAPPWRGRGVAARLADAVIDWARQEGAARIGLWSPADNPRACRFYERQGFRSTGKTRPFPGHPGRSIAEMCLDLP